MLKRIFSYELGLIENCLKIRISNPPIKLLLNCRAIAWVASGLSLCTAEFGRKIMQDYCNIPGNVYTPLDFATSNVKEFFPVLISYRGKNLDIKSAARKINQTKVKDLLLISGFKNSPVERYSISNNVKVQCLSLPIHKEENRFVSVLSVFALCALTQRLAERIKGKIFLSFEELELIYDSANEESEKIFYVMTKTLDIKNYKLIALGNGLNSPALNGLKSAFAESGLATIITGDIKDYSHGKYLSAFREKKVAYLLFENKFNHNMANILYSRLSPSFPIIRVNINETEISGLWKEIFFIFLLTLRLSNFYGFNLKHPPKPKNMKRWSNWGVI